MGVPLVVLDTNVLVAAIRSRRGASFRLLEQVGLGRFDIVLSVALGLEYEEVLDNIVNRPDWMPRTSTTSSTTSARSAINKRSFTSGTLLCPIPTTTWSWRRLSPEDVMGSSHLMSATSLGPIGSASGSRHRENS